MLDRTFLATFTLACLIGGTAAIGAELLGVDARNSAAQASSKHVRVVQLEPVLIVGKRLAPATRVAGAQTSDVSAPRVE